MPQTETAQRKHKTEIEWTHFPGYIGATLNPIRARNKATGDIGHYCRKISPGCANCYAAEWNKRRRFKTKTAGTGLDFTRENAQNVELFLDNNILKKPLGWKQPHAIFWNDMTDLFLGPDDDPALSDDVKVNYNWIDSILAIMALTPQHKHLILTKRPRSMREYFNQSHGDYGRWDQLLRLGDFPWPERATEDQIDKADAFFCNNITLPNLLLGTSIENNDQLHRAETLSQIPAACRFLSIEPQLGPVTIGAHLERITNANQVSLETETLIKWIILGGESGKDARETELQNIRNTRDQAIAAGVPVFIKQLGSNLYADLIKCPACKRVEDIQHYDALGLDEGDIACSTCGQIFPQPDTHQPAGKGGKPEDWPEDLRLRQFPTLEH